MDGTYGITQCSISPNTSFTYNFTLQQSGTYWYHAHYATTYQDGLFGPLIIHGRNEPNYNVSGDFIVMVDDWYHDFSTDLLPAFFAVGNQGVEPVPDNGLINGYKPMALKDWQSQNVFACERAPDGHSCDNSSTGYAMFTVDPKSRYRFRVINTGAFADFKFSVDNHALEVFDSLNYVYFADDRSRRHGAWAHQHSYILHPCSSTLLLYTGSKSDRSILLDQSSHEHQLFQPW